MTCFVHYSWTNKSLIHLNSILDWHLESWVTRLTDLDCELSGVRGSGEGLKLDLGIDTRHESHSCQVTVHRWQRHYGKSDTFRNSMSKEMGENHILPNQLSQLRTHQIKLCFLSKCASFVFFSLFFPLMHSRNETQWNTLTRYFSFTQGHVVSVTASPPPLTWCPQCHLSAGPLALTASIPPRDTPSLLRPLSPYSSEPYPHTGFPIQTQKRKDLCVVKQSSREKDMETATNIDVWEVVL